ncbi:hypothetical protein GF345_06110 [Candidatus Woesearchaeota archaeon]|nr:hypothetical protein [Candidatus Woesearchaeota archaeon]
MNKRLTDFEETKEIVIGHARAMNKRPERTKLAYEEDSVLNSFFEDK